MAKSITVLGSYVADLAFRTGRLPGWGETVIGSGFQLGPGGKGSNQAVAAARLGARVSFISKLARDPFGDLARHTYAAEGIDARFVFETTEHPTGAATVIVHEEKGENAIVVFPGACFHVTTNEIDQAREQIAASAVFMTQLETNTVTVEYSLCLAHGLGVTTILNPAPATPLAEHIYPLCDYLTPNESEAAALTGITVCSLADAESAADVLLSRGARNTVITLGEQGAFVKNTQIAQHIPAFHPGPVIETTGAGDAFNGGLAVALSEGSDLLAATRFACAVAGISVTRPGTTPAMPRRAEVEALLARS